MAPSLPITAFKTTAPCTRAILAICGYCGSTRRTSNPWVTPDETRMRCGVATLGAGALLVARIEPITPPIDPPGTPPGTPPTTPASTGGGDVSSLIILTCLGILVGWRSWL